MRLWSCGPLFVRSSGMVAFLFLLPMHKPDVSVRLRRLERATPRARECSRPGCHPRHCVSGQLRVTAAAERPLLAGIAPKRGDRISGNPTSRGRPVAVGGLLAVALAMGGLVTLAPPCRKPPCIPLWFRVEMGLRQKMRTPP